MIVSVFRKAHFNAAHRLHNPAWSDERNAEVFGVCNNPNYHGHNYDITIKLTGEVRPETGYVFDMKELSDIIREQIEERFDHKNLNLDTVEFKNLNPTAEHIAYVIYNILKNYIPSDLKLGVTIHETPRNYVEYNGQE